MKIQPDVYLTAIGLPPIPQKYVLFGWEEEPITAKQKEKLEEYGVAYSHIKYKGQASMILSTIFKRHSNGLASPKQIQVLLKNGYEISKIKYLTCVGASKIIKKLIA